MPKDRDSSSGHAQDGESSLLKNLILLALPLLSLQRDVLAIVKKGIQDTSHVKPVQNLTLRELQALMMILDPKRKLRDRFGADFEKKLEDLYKETTQKLVSGSIQLIEAQEIISQRVSEALVTLKNGRKPKSHTSEKSG
jgi:hypothetical protein